MSTIGRSMDNPIFQRASKSLFKACGKPMLSMFPVGSQFEVEKEIWEVKDFGNLVNLMTGEQYQMPQIGWDPK